MIVQDIKQTLRNLYVYRGFIAGTVKREFQLRYHGALLGVLWTILQPLTMILVYTVIFSQLMRARLPGIDSTYAYGIFVCAGVLTWNLFTDIVIRSTNLFIDNANLIKKSNFPKSCLPAISLCSALLNFLIILALFFGFLLITHNFPGIVVLGMIPLLILEITFAVSLGLFLGTLNVFFRDAGQFNSVLLQLWLWATPVIYPLSVIPAKVQTIILLNPLTAIALGFQRIFINQAWPRWDSFAYTITATVCMLMISVSFFTKRSPEIVDEL